MCLSRRLHRVATLQGVPVIGTDDTSPAEQTLEGNRSLLDGFRRGSAQALHEVFTLYAPIVARAIRSGVVVQVDGRPTRIGAHLSEFDFENLLQETFARAFKESARLSFDGLRPYRSYIVTIAKNLLVDRARKAKRDRAVVLTEDIERYGGQDRETPEKQVIDAEMHRVLAQFRTSLTGDVLRVFLCRYEKERSLREAAKELDMTMWHLRRIDARIRLSLLETLRNAGFLEDTNVTIGEAVLNRTRSSQESS